MLEVICTAGCMRSGITNKTTHPTPPCGDLPAVPEVVECSTASGRHICIVDEGIIDMFDRENCKTTWILLYQAQEDLYINEPTKPEYAYPLNHDIQ